MKKIILCAAAVLFVGVCSSTADNPNACRFKDGNGDVWNGHKSTVTRTWTDEGSSTSSSSHSGTVSSDLKVLGGNVTGNEGSSTSRSKSTITSTTTEECCEQNVCSPDYRTGHVKTAKNADNSSW